ncbi:hypothetical protein LTR64_005903 [Lithohypha guttulata]|uniref:uncharacterized protein n=1 Tax=Lithohypha guttulata TaxID=1690604 RepID=UPI002DDEB0DE|nr:hypothetical protein LTR51_002300 [Lithohypha guttulata]
MSERARGRGRGRGQGRGRLSNRGSYGDRRNGVSNPQTLQSNGDVDGEYNAHLTERFKGRSARNGDSNRRFNRETKLQLALNPDLSKYVTNQEAISRGADPDDWLAIPEIPPAGEILIPEGEAVSLPRNKIDQPWSKKEKYLKAHYKFLREDAIAPLREAVAKFRRDPQRMDDNDTRIYEQVRIVGLTFTYKGICSRIRFSLARATRRISWQASKRLTSGTLVALTPTKDAFQNRCILAVVAARPLDHLEQEVPEIDILFGDHNSHEVDPQQTYIMIEASQGYFEAYRHTMRALQKQSAEPFPLAEHICHLEWDVGPPQYLIEEPDRDITPAADQGTLEAFQNVNLLRQWPSSPTRTLDSTQWAAMKDILTRKLAIIQGPPGTGKTHVSKIAIEIMLRNRKPGDPPIIVACQTNHALDQLLGFVNKFEPNFIRLGGRSTNVLTKARALHEVRKAQVYDDPLGSCFAKARRDINTQTLKLKSLLSPVRADGPSLMTSEVLFNLGVINAQQRKSLEKGAADWLQSDAVPDEPLQMWLGDSVKPFVPIYSNDNFGFQEAEEDLELEQRRELDAEMGVADEEDYEMLRGDYLSLAIGQTMSQPTAQTIGQAKRLLDTAKDLYQVPKYLKGPMYMIMQEKAIAIVRRRLREGANDYAGMCSQIQIGRWEKDAAYLAEAPIIGMTTTGLSKYRALVSSLKPKIILIEEAAEVLEAPVSVACVASLQHLILVGDHQQLQANCSVKELAGDPYYLNISMFERLVRNKLPHRTLLKQRRMEPEFRELIQPIYPGLTDDDSVATRDRTEWGTGSIFSWFLNHDFQEHQDESMSTYNAHEAALIARFYRHLIRNRVPPAAITVLTFYNGQRKKILRALKDDPETASVYNKVKTVDSYQGEENHIILLSLVRNNASGKIGFLDINNRIVVALSRAKYGFYLFGNGNFLAEHNEVWSYVEDRLWKQGRSKDSMNRLVMNDDEEEEEEKESRRVIREGKKPEPPVQQPRGPPAWGYDGTNETSGFNPEGQRVRPEEAFVAIITQSAEIENESFLGWKSPKEVEWEEEQAALNGNGFW